MSYYHRWALALESNLTERGYVSPEELSAGHASAPGKTLRRRLTVDAVGRGLHRGSFYRPQQPPAGFKPNGFF